MRPRRGWTVRIASVTMAGLLLFVLWRAFGQRPFGRFPVLRDVPILHLPVGPASVKVRPALRAAAQAQNARGSGGSFRFLVDLAVQLDFQRFARVVRGRGMDKPRRRTAILEALRLVAGAHQQDLLGALEEMRKSGRVVRFDPFRIVNRVAVVASDPGVVSDLAARADVVELVEDVAEPDATVLQQAHPPGRPVQPELGLFARRPVSVRPAEPLSWAIDAIRAPEAWKRGFDGQGVVVGILDSGVRGDHDQLRDNWRGVIEPARARDSFYHPLDPQASSPIDTSWHGTTVLSAAVGLNRPLRDGRRCVIGAAPGAAWVAAVAFFEGRHDHLVFTAAADWMLFFARPDVLIHAATYADEWADPRADRMFDAFKAAETVVVFSAGNVGPESGRNHGPANFLALGPFGMPAFAVGARRPDGQVSAFSARGPSARDPLAPFPQVVAPGEDVTVAFAGRPDAIIRDLGTSPAAGYAAGAAAIVLQAAPGLPGNEVEFLLKQSARSVTNLRPNNETGWGSIDVVGALDLLDLERRAEPKPKHEASGP
jgi:subtilisin family serine protease